MTQMSKRKEMPMDDEARMRIVDQLRDAAAKIEIGQNVSETLKKLKYSAIAWHKWSEIKE